MDILKAEISRKRKQVEEAQLTKDDKKYFKRAELKAKLEEDYWRRHGYLEPGEDGGGQAPSTSSVSVKDRERDSDVTAAAAQKMLPRKEVVRQLRQRCEPVRLFGETDFEAYERLRRLEILEPEAADRGMRNEFQEAVGKLEAEYLAELAKYESEDSGGRKINPNDVQIKEDDTTYDDLKGQVRELVDKGNPSQQQEVILKYLRYLQQQWGKSLNTRDDTVKASTRGRLLAAQFRQTDDYIKPLFSMLRKKNTPSDILDCLVKIVDHMLVGDYIRANDSYMEMAIGNAAWPVGVTNPGIHARPGREKIFAKQVAHVLNDETQRKYIQALKRLMTQCQILNPSQPSLSVNYSFERM